MVGFCSGMGAGGWLLMIGLWAAFLGFVVWALTRLFPGDPHRGAVEVLDRRLAAGDIDPDTYRQARDELAGTRS